MPPENSHPLLSAATRGESNTSLARKANPSAPKGSEYFWTKTFSTSFNTILNKMNSSATNYSIDQKGEEAIDSDVESIDDDDDGDVPVTQHQAKTESDDVSPIICSLINGYSMYEPTIIVFHVRKGTTLYANVDEQSWNTANLVGRMAMTRRRRKLNLDTLAVKEWRRNHSRQCPYCKGYKKEYTHLSGDRIRSYRTGQCVPPPSSYFAPIVFVMICSDATDHLETQKQLIKFAEECGSYIKLSNLDSLQTASYTSHCLEVPRRTLPNELVEYVYRVSGGIPQYIYLTAQQLLRCEGGEEAPLQIERVRDFGDDESELSGESQVQKPHTVTHGIRTETVLQSIFRQAKLGNTPSTHAGDGVMEDTTTPELHTGIASPPDTRLRRTETLDSHTDTTGTNTITDESVSETVRRTNSLGAGACIPSTGTKALGNNIGNLGSGLRNFGNVNRAERSALCSRQFNVGYSELKALLYDESFEVSAQHEAMTDIVNILRPKPNRLFPPRNRRNKDYLNCLKQPRSFLIKDASSNVFKSVYAKEFKESPTAFRCLLNQRGRGRRPARPLRNNEIRGFEETELWLSRVVSVKVDAPALADVPVAHEMKAAALSLVERLDPDEELVAQVASAFSSAFTALEIKAIYPHSPLSTQRLVDIFKKLIAVNLFEICDPPGDYFVDTQFLKASRTVREHERRQMRGASAMHSQSHTHTHTHTHTSPQGESSDSNVSTENSFCLALDLKSFLSLKTPISVSVEDVLPFMCPTSGRPLFYRFRSIAFQHVIANHLMSENRTCFARMSTAAAEYGKKHGFPALLTNEFQEQLHSLLQSEIPDPSHVLRSWQGPIEMIQYTIQNSSESARSGVSESVSEPETATLRVRRGAVSDTMNR